MNYPPTAEGVNEMKRSFQSNLRTTMRSVKLLPCGGNQSEYPINGEMKCNINRQCEQVRQLDLNRTSRWSCHNALERGEQWPGNGVNELNEAIARSRSHELE